MERDGWDYDDLDEDINNENNFRNNYPKCDCLDCNRNCKTVQKGQDRKEDKSLKK